MEAGSVAESESLLGLALCDLLLLLLLLLLAAAPAVFAIGIERWLLLLLMMALLEVKLPITDYLLRVKQCFFLVSRQASCCARHRCSTVAAVPADAAAADELTVH